MRKLTGNHYLQGQPQPPPMVEDDDSSDEDGDDDGGVVQRDGKKVYFSSSFQQQMALHSSPKWRKSARLKISSIYTVAFSRNFIS